MDDMMMEEIMLDAVDPLEYTEGEIITAGSSTVFPLAKKWQKSGQTLVVLHHPSHPSVPVLVLNASVLKAKLTSATLPAQSVIAKSKAVKQSVVHQSNSVLVQMHWL